MVMDSEAEKMSLLAKSWRRRFFLLLASVIAFSGGFVLRPYWEQYQIRLGDAQPHPVVAECDTAAKAAYYDALIFTNLLSEGKRPAIAKLKISIRVPSEEDVDQLRDKTRELDVLVREAFAQSPKYVASVEGQREIRNKLWNDLLHKFPDIKVCDVLIPEVLLP